MTERRHARSRWAAAAALLSGLMVLGTPLNEWLSGPFTDWQLRLLAPQQPPAGVLVVDFDDASLAALREPFGPWPFGRDVHALLVETLRELGARAVAFDLLLIDTKPGDEALARSLARPGAPVLLAAAGLNHTGGDSLSPAWPVAQEAGEAAEAGTRSAIAAGTPGQRAAAAPPLAHRWPTIVLPSPSLWPAPGQPPPLGVITTPLDTDGVLRRLPLWHEAEGQRWPVLPLAMHQLLTPEAVNLTPPLDAGGALRLALAPARAAPPTLPASALLLRGEGRVVPDALRAQVQGRVVFIGSSALLGDRVLTVHGQRPGVQVLAEAYAALRDGHWVRPPSAPLNAALLVVALLPTVWGARRRRIVSRQAVVAALWGLGALAGMAGLSLWQLQLPLWWAAPLVTLTVGLGMALLLQAREQAALQRRMAHELAVTAEAARAKGQFLANVSHEIRTPLNAIMGVAELLAESSLSPPQRRQVQLFQEAGQTLMALINNLLDLSRIEADRFELERLPFSLHRLLQHLVALLRPQASRKGLGLRLELHADVPDGVSGDRLRVERAVSNLLGNAIKFTDRGEVCLRVGCGAAGTNELVFEFIDSGIGIAPSKLDTIFEPFSQADSSVARRFGGTGLGLALTRNVAKLMGGSVSVHSTPGVGSCFVLRLVLPPAELALRDAVANPGADVGEVGVGVDDSAAPTGQAAHEVSAGTEPHSADIGREAAAAAPPVLQRRLLLAEDNEVNAYIFTAMLADEAVCIDIAPNGLEALALLRSKPYDMAYIDVQMPDLDGLSLTRQLREWERETGRPRLPLVSLTANAFAADVQASLAAGSDLHLPKPYTKAELIDSLRRLAPKRRSDAPGRAEDALPPAPLEAQAGVGVDATTATFEPEAARQSLGVAPDTYAAILAHARVFLQDWLSALARAQEAADWPHMQALAQDLHGVASRLGAQQLQTAALALKLVLADSEARRLPAAQATQAARTRVQQALVPVLLALRASASDSDAQPR